MEVSHLFERQDYATCTVAVGGSYLALVGEPTFKRVMVLDTNVLLHDPNCFSRFEEDLVVLPIEVIEEIDDFKRREDEVGRNARVVIRSLDELRRKGSLTEGVTRNGGPTIRVELEQEDLSTLPTGFRSEKKDNRVLATAKYTVRRYEGKEVVFISKDINLRIKGNAIGLKTEDYDIEGPRLEELYTGVKVVETDGAGIINFYKDGKLTMPVEDLHPNQFVVLQNTENQSQQALGMRDGLDSTVRPIRLHEKNVSGISPRNREQRFALELLMDENIKLVTCVGGAGTGKTLLALAAGLAKVLDENAYTRLSISRPIIPLGRDLGYLPGSKEEKMDPWMKPVVDNLEFIFSNRQSAHGEFPFEELQEQRLLEVEPITYIRGRSLPNQFFIVDEAQNLTPHEAKTVLTRVGEGTKVVFTGDPSQIDHPYLDSQSNGLTYIVERFKDIHLAGHITLVKGERSELAELAAGIM